jgi:hypothetical protein
LAGEDWRTAPPPQQPHTWQPQPQPRAWQTAPPPPVAAPHNPYPVAPARDHAYAIGQPLLKIAQVLARAPFGWLVLIAGWGLSLPAVILTRPSWPQAARLALATIVLAGWVALIVSEAVS